MDEAIADDDSYDSSILLPDSILNFSPSQKDKIDQTEELLYRVYGCELIQEAGILLKLPQVVMATGQNIFHRFFYRKSLERFDSFTVAMGSVLLASKIEEKLKYLRDIIFVFHHIYQRRKGLKLKPLELGGVRYTEWKGELITMERYLLKELGFSFYNILDHPHKYILYYVKMLDGTSELSQLAWNYLNDSLRLDLSLRYPAEEIACAAIYMAARKCGFSLPDNPPWWRLMMSDKNKLLLICDRVLELYHMPKVLFCMSILILLTTRCYTINAVSNLELFL
jgi:cyclin L